MCLIFRPPSAAATPEPTANTVETGASNHSTVMLRDRRTCLYCAVFPRLLCSGKCFMLPSLWKSLISTSLPHLNKIAITAVACGYVYFKWCPHVQQQIHGHFSSSVGPLQSLTWQGSYQPGEAARIREGHWLSLQVIHIKACHMEPQEDAGSWV